MIGNLAGDPRAAVQSAPRSCPCSKTTALHPHPVEDAMSAPAVTRSRTPGARRHPGSAGWPRTARAGDPNKYFVVSADTHANEPASLWRERIDAKYKRPPAAHRGRRQRRALERDGGLPAAEAARLAVRGRGPDPLEGRRRPRGAAARPRRRRRRRRGDLPEQGSLDVGDRATPCSRTRCARSTTSGPGRRSAAYNDRLSPLACVATGDLDGAIAEIERTAALGFRALHLAVQAELGRARRRRAQLQPARVRPALGLRAGDRASRSPSTSRPGATRAPRAATAAR